MVSAALCAATFAISFAQGLALAQDAQRAGDIENGKRLYYEHGCYGCHGFNGETGARDLVGTGSPIVENEDAFVQYLRLRADQAPLLPSTRMPNYPEEALSDAEVRAIFAYVNTFVLDAPDVEDVPAFETILESAASPYEP